MKKIIFSAPGKIHIMGEHSVVYGKPAFLAAINLRARVSISVQNSPQLLLEQSLSPNMEKVKKAVESVIKKEYDIKQFPSYTVAIDSQIPIGCGLGSSAAISSAFIAALLTFLDKKWDLTLINDLTYKAEKVFHGNPSGGDNTVVVFGDFVWFRKELEFLKYIMPLSFSHFKKNQFVLINSGVPKESTKEMVDFVTSITSSSKQLIFEDQEETTKKIVTAFKENNKKEVASLILRGEKNLEKLGIVGKKAKKIIRLLETNNCVAKVVGAGGIKDGSGMIVCFSENSKGLIEFAKKHTLEAFQISLGEEGLRREV